MGATAMFFILVYMSITPGYFTQDAQQAAWKMDENVQPKFRPTVNMNKPKVITVKQNMRLPYREVLFKSNVSLPDDLTFLPENNLSVGNRSRSKESIAIGEKWNTFSKGTQVNSRSDRTETLAMISKENNDDPLEKYNIANQKEYPLPKLNGVSELVEMGYEIPRLEFDYDDSAEARVQRTKDRVAELISEGMDESIAQLRAQLLERELADRKARAEHARNRAIVRQRQEAKMKRDAELREARVALMREKQELVAAMLERSKRQRAEEASRRTMRRKEIETQTLHERKRY
eukprot:gene2676-5568_t